MRDSRKPAPPITIHDVHDLDAKAAGLELLTFGFTIIDDISGELVETAELELLEQLGHAADAMDLHIVRVDTGWGPVFIFRDRSRVTLAFAKKVVFAQRPKP
jgi:hypothetical protein